MGVSRGGFRLMMLLAAASCSKNVASLDGAGPAPMPQPAAGGQPGGNPHAGGMMGGGPMAPAGAEPAWTITGTIRLAPELEGKVGATDVLYVLARVAGQRMPLAVERVPAPAFPLAYTLSSGHAGGAAGGPPSALEVVARVSRAGTAGPAQPGDLEGTFDGQAAPGATGVDIVIGKQY